MVKDKTFREDLFYRLHVVRVHMPPLRDRPTDIEPLAQCFLQAACARNGIARRQLPREASGWLQSQSWPGNVRQLKNVIEATAILAEADELTVADLQSVAAPTPSRSPDGGTDWFVFERLDEFRAATEKEFLRRKLLENNGNIKRTAERIQLMRSNLYKKLDRYGLK